MILYNKFRIKTRFFFFAAGGSLARRTFIKNPGAEKVKNERGKLARAKKPPRLGREAAKQHTCLDRLARGQVQLSDLSHRIFALLERTFSERTRCPSNNIIILKIQIKNS